MVNKGDIDVSLIVHDLRTPLNAIVGYTELLLEDAVAAGRSSEESDLRRIVSAAQTLKERIDDLVGTLKAMQEP